MTETLAIAKQIAESEPAMVTAYKSLIDDGYDSPFGEALKLEDERSTRWAQEWTAALWLSVSHNCAREQVSNASAE